jgi:hypothetical protein
MRQGGGPGVPVRLVCAVLVAGLLAVVGCGSSAGSPAAPGSPEAALGKPAASGKQGRALQGGPSAPGPPSAGRPSQPLPAVPAQAPFTAVRWIRVPGGAWQAVIGAGALFTDSSDAASPVGTGTLITRVDLATGEVGPAIRIEGESGMVFGGGLLWVGRGTQPTSADMSVVALDPVTLAVRHAVALRQPPSFGTEQIACAGSLVWVATEHSLIGIDTATARTVADVPIPRVNARDFVHVAASADGSALWTAEDSGGGGPISVQQRNPRTGAVLAAASGPAIGLGGAQIAAARQTAWLAYATGMGGGYFGTVSEAGHLTETLPPRSSVGFTNAIRVYLAGRQLWITDAMTGTVACASSATGRVIAIVRGSGLLPADIDPDGAGRLVLLVNGDILIARPKRACGR